MKTLVAVLIALGGGTTLGVAAVLGVQASVNPDTAAVQHADQGQVNVLVYGNR